MSIQQAIAANLADIVNQAGSQKSNFSTNASPTILESQDANPAQGMAGSADLLLTTQYELILQFELRIANLIQQSQELEMDIEMLNSQLESSSTDSGKQCLELNSQQWVNKAKSLDNQVEKLRQDLDSKHFLRFNDQSLNVDLATRWEELQIRQQNLANSLERFGNSQLLPPQVISQILELEMAKVQLRSDYLVAQEELVQTTQTAIDNINLKNYQAATMDCGRLRDLYSRKSNLLLDQYREAAAVPQSQSGKSILNPFDGVRLCTEKDAVLNQRLKQQMNDLEKLGNLLISNIKKRLPREVDFVRIAEQDLQTANQIQSQVQLWSQFCLADNPNLNEILQHRKEKTKVSLLLSSLLINNLTPVERWWKLLNQLSLRPSLSTENQNWLTTALNALQKNLPQERLEFLEIVKLVQSSHASWSELEQNGARLQLSRRSQNQQLEQLASDNLSQFLKDRSQLLNTFRINSENEIKRIQQRYEECERRNNESLDSRLRELAGSQQTLLYHLNDQAPVPGTQSALLQNRSAEFQRFSKLFQELEFINESMFKLSSQQNRLRKSQQRVKKMKSDFENLSQLSKNNLDLIDCRHSSLGNQTGKTNLSSKPFVNLVIEIDGIQSIDSKLEGMSHAQIILEIAGQKKSLILPIDDDSSGPAANLLFNRIPRTGVLNLTIESDNQLQRRIYGKYQIALSDIEEEQTWIDSPFGSLSASSSNLLEPVLRVKLE